jgi:60 kDa SS-A/Ro ribonucleoprotein
VVDALNDAFYHAFDNVEATGKRWLLGVDVSGSMSMGAVAGVAGMTPRVAAAAMTLVTAATEPQHVIMSFQTSFVPLSISPRERLDDVVRKTDGLPFGGTDCALPMLYAMERKLKVDVFVVYTDSETWFGQIHPVQALRQYREKTGIPAKLIVQAFVANRFSIADPDDAGMLDVIGFDTAVPTLIRDFAAS